MAAENEVQFFEAPFQYSIWEFSSNVNLTYHKLINTRPIKMPQMNTWFETPFSQAYNEKWDKAYFWIRKREWFQRCMPMEEQVRQALLSTWYIITDHQIVDWCRFLMICNDDYSRMCILKSNPWRYIDCIPQSQDICLWDYDFVTNEISRVNYFLTTPCSYHKFQKINTLQATEKESRRNLYIWNAIMEWWSTTAVIFNKDRKIIDWFVVWKYAQVSNSDNVNIVLWQSLQIWYFDAENWWYNMWYWSWVWVTDEVQEPLYDEYWNQIWVLNYQWPVDINLYEWVKPWIAFYWWRERNGNHWIFEYTWQWFQFVQQTNLHNAEITSLTEDFDWLVYTTNRWYLYFLRQHSNWMQSLWWTIYSSNYMYWWWDLAKWCWDYVFLFWPDSMWIAYKNWTDERWDYRWNVQVLDRSLWYWNKDSVLVYNEELYMIDNKKRFVKLDLEATTDSYYRVHFKLQTTDMSLHWINTDLRNLDREQWQKVSLCKDDYRIYIIINDSINEAPSWHINTKILVYEDELKYRHWRYVCWLDIRYFSEWQWIWRWIFVPKWEDDNWRKFKQIISMSFWDTSWFTWKEVLWIKAAIWYHSKITNNTIFKFRADWWWYSKTIKMNTLSEVSYIKAINKLRESWKTDIDDLQMIYRAMPIGIGIYSWNWIWLEEDIIRTADKEFDAYCDYEPTMIYKKENCCDVKPASEADDNGCTMKAPDADKENFWSSRLQYHFNVAKYSTIPIDIWQQWQNFFIELIANEYDSIEFCGFMVWWMFMDNNFDSIANKPFYQDTPKDSLPWMMWK